MDLEGSPTESTPTGGKSDFVPPATQADLDKIIEARIARERAKFSDYDTLKAAAKKLTDLEDSQKSEAQRLTGRVSELEAQVATYEKQAQLRGWTAEVAAAEGVPSELLRGTTREELETHARALKAALAAQPGALRIPTPATGDRKSDRDGAARAFFGV